MPTNTQGCKKCLAQFTDLLSHAKTFASSLLDFHLAFTIIPPSKRHSPVPGKYTCFCGTTLQENPGSFVHRTRTNLWSSSILAKMRVQLPHSLDILHHEYRHSRSRDSRLTFGVGGTVVPINIVYT